MDQGPTTATQNKFSHNRSHLGRFGYKTTMNTILCKSVREVLATMKLSFSVAAKTITIPNSANTTEDGKRPSGEENSRLSKGVKNNMVRGEKGIKLRKK